MIKKLKYTLTASLMKVVLMPLIVLGIAIALGFRGVHLGVIFILFGGPSAVSGYIMAKNMGSDYELSGHITLLTTLLCIGTIFLGVFFLKYFSMI